MDWSVTFSVSRWAGLKLTTTFDSTQILARVHCSQNNRSISSLSLLHVSYIIFYIDHLDTYYISSYIICSRYDTWHTVTFKTQHIICSRYDTWHTVTFKTQHNQHVVLYNISIEPYPHSLQNQNNVRGLCLFDIASDENCTYIT